jgi:lysophospholipase L1-like esterase
MLEHPRGRSLLTTLSAIVVAITLSLAFAAASVAKPTAVVAMGDSEISGEGAGSYQSGTNGPSNYCHRSLNAWIIVVSIPVDAHINLACSGADSANLKVGGPGQYGEISQADQLAAVARKYRVKYVFVTVGANDDPQFGKTASDCVYAYVFQTGYGCAQIDGPTWPKRVADMQPKVREALQNVRGVMQSRGYSSSSYQLVVVSYASPAPRAPTRYSDSNYWGKVWAGCPLYDSDATWGHDEATPILDNGEREVATAENLRFIDAVQAFEGHELCAQGITASQEWVKGLTYDPSSSTWWSSHAVQQSFHPNARGHSKLAGCVAEFAAQAYREGICVVGSDGNVHAQQYG